MNDDAPKYCHVCHAADGGYSDSQFLVFAGADYIARSKFLGK
jgi:hypothetical protein